MQKLKSPFLEYNFYFHQTDNEFNFNIISNFFEKNEIKETKNKQISLLDISKDAKNHGDKNPIGVWMSGDKFSFPEKNKKEMLGIKRARLNLYRFFKSIVSDTCPDYAAITSEYSMESPYDLQNRSYAFQDVYLNENIINNKYFYKLKSWCEKNNIYTEKIGQGLYISTSPLFNPLYLDNTIYSSELCKKTTKAIFKSYYPDLEFGINIE